MVAFILSSDQRKNAPDHRQQIVINLILSSDELPKKSKERNHMKNYQSLYYKNYFAQNADGDYIPVNRKDCSSSPVRIFFTLTGITTLKSGMNLRFTACLKPLQKSSVITYFRWTVWPTLFRFPKKESRSSKIKFLFLTQTAPKKSSGGLFRVSALKLWTGIPISWSPK